MPFEVNGIETNVTSDDEMNKCLDDNGGVHLNSITQPSPLVSVLTVTLPLQPIPITSYAFNNLLLAFIMPWDYLSKIIEFCCEWRHLWEITFYFIKLITSTIRPQPNTNRNVKCMRCMCECVRLYAHQCTFQNDSNL